LAIASSVASPSHSRDRWHSRNSRTDQGVSTGKNAATQSRPQAERVNAHLRADSGEGVNSQAISPEAILAVLAASILAPK
jgi:hypothetical protein